MKAIILPTVFQILFLILPAAAQDLSSSTAVVYGDSRTGHEIHKKIVAGILRWKPAAVFHVGDFVGKDKNLNEWARFREITAELRNKTDFFPARGNHEGNGKNYFRQLEIPGNKKWYSLDRNGINFIILDSESALGKGSEQYNWLAAQLSTSSGKNLFTAVIMHIPVFTSGKHGSDRELAASLVPLFEKYGVDIVFAGHDHDYERLYKDGVCYIVTGGGGAPLYDLKKKNPYSQLFLKKYNYCVLSVSEDGLSINVFDEENKRLDSFIVPKRKARGEKAEVNRAQAQ
ncbi:MAG: metallophosphoesterase [Elusimicrobia bacterium]|nr:metallophosphoesterase [Elusimicrobiota bacterium]